MDNLGLQRNAKSCLGWSVFLFALLVAVDQLVKSRAAHIFYNSAFAFSVPLPTWLIYTIYLIVLLGLAAFAVKNFYHLTKLNWLALTLIFAGALSNIVERLMFGSVRDFIYITFYKWTGVYNLADGYIILGIIILLLSGPKDRQQKNA